MRRTPMPPPSKPMRRGTPLQSRTPISPVSAKRRRDNTARRQVVSAMRAAVKGRCARCGGLGLPVHGHERLARAQGGDILNPDCLLCTRCNTWCEDHPRAAAYTGWKISGKHPHSAALELGQAVDLEGRIVTFTVDGAP